MGFFVAIWLIYLALTTNLAWNNLLVGLGVAAIASGLLPRKREVIEWRRMPAALWAGIQYTGLLLYDLLSSGFQVARIVMSPTLPIKPGIVAIPVRCESNEGIALSAHALTLTPGQLVIEIGDDKTLYTHCLVLEDSEKTIQDAQALRETLLNKIIK